MKRKAISEQTQASLLLKSRRRCCLCFWLNGEDEVKKGQIAHLDGDNKNSTESNLVFLCFEHHDEYDSITRLSRGLRRTEVKNYRDKMYEQLAGRPRLTTSFGPRKLPRFFNPSSCTPSLQQKDLSLAQPGTIVQPSSVGYTLGDLTIPYLPVLDAWDNQVHEFHRCEIRINAEPNRYRLPDAMRPIQEPDYRPDRLRYGLTRFEYGTITHQGPSVPTITVQEMNYRDHLRALNKYKECLPDDPTQKFGDLYRSRIRNLEDYLQLKVPKVCGVGLFIISADEMVVVAHRSARNVTDLPNALSYTASGSADSIDLFGEVARECREEVNYAVDPNSLTLFSIGIDLNRFVFQFSFLGESPLSATEIRADANHAKTRYEWEDLKLIPFKPAPVLQWVLDPQWKWEPAAQAALVTLLMKRFGRDTVRAELKSIVSDSKPTRSASLPNRKNGRSLIRVGNKATGSCRRRCVSAS